ncbi:MAG: NAD-dependent epimerase/dehydratase family protein, partial [Candidatus Micrarchaeota archaeon]
MAKKRVLITGGSGFIGRNLVERLSKKHEVSSPPHSELDLTDSGAVEGYLKKNHFDVVVHAAGVGSSRKNSDSREMLGANIRQFYNLVCCREAFGRMIQLGSGAEYDKSRPIVNVREEEFGKSIPKDDYGFYKYACSRFIENSENIACIRPFGCYGKYEDYETRFISNSICRVLFGLPPVIRNRNVVFSYLFVDDLAKVVDSFIKKEPKHKFYNVTPDEKTDLLSISNKIIKVSGKKLEVV